jgi:imidazoleglycerol-phosphate dehydratase
MDRRSDIERNTKETKIKSSILIDGSGIADIDTGIGFLDHMLTALAVHADFDLKLKCKGDLNVDGHHTVEDVGIVIGKSLAEALGDKVGIARYGNFTVPMDESLAICALDISGRAYLIFNAEFLKEKVGDLETDLVEEFFRAVAFNAGITLHINAPYGENDHHKAEAIFKSFAHSIKAAVKIDSDKVLSSKGVLS